MNDSDDPSKMSISIGDIPQAPLLVAFSGGVDSTVLLHLLASTAAARRVGLRAIHVDHGLHGDSAAWALHCRAASDALAVPLALVRVNVEPTGEGLEAAARTARHAAFEAALHEGEILVLAHHRDDQAETFLLRALRASGADGLGAMRPWRSFGRGRLWRPLLDRPRSELLAYARAQDLRWIQDPGNADLAQDRNFLRHRVLPLLRERWPRAEAAFARSAMLSAQAAELLALEDSQALACVREAGADDLDVARLRRLPATRQARVLRRWISERRLPPLPSQGVARIQADLLHARPDAEATFAWSGAVITRWRGLLHAQAYRPSLPSGWHVDWDGIQPLLLPGGGMLRLLGGRGFDAPVMVRARRGGERITLPGRSHSHALKNILQERRVPPWQRRRLPLVSDVDGALLCAGDLVHSASFDAWLRAHDAQLQWIAGDD